MAISREKTHLAVASHIAYLFRRFSDMYARRKRNYGTGKFTLLSLSLPHYYRFTRLEESISTSEGKGGNLSHFLMRFLRWIPILLVQPKYASGKLLFGGGVGAGGEDDSSIGMNKACLCLTAPFRGHKSFSPPPPPPPLHSA